MMEGALRWTLELPDTASAMAFAPDGRRVAVATLAGDVVMVNVSTGEVSPTGASHRGGSLAVAWHPAGELLATADQDGRVCLVEPGFSERPTYRSFGRGWVDHLAWSSDGAYLAIAAGKAVHVVATTGESVAELSTKSTVDALAWLPGLPTLITAGFGGAYVHDIRERKAPVELDWPGALLSLAPSPDGKVIAAGCQECALQLWDWPSGRPSEVTGFDTKVRSLAWNRTGSLLAAAGGSVVTLWPFADGGPVGKKPTVLQGHARRVTGLAFLGNNGMASIDESGRLITWRSRGARWTTTGGLPWKAPLVGLAATAKAVVVAASDASLLVLAVGTQE
jgi:YD repeat-containing protein